MASTSPSWWPWGKKEPVQESAIASNTMPQLPSQSASPEATMASQGYGAPAAVTPPNAYSAAPASYNPYAAPAGASSASSGTGLYDTPNSGGYPGYAASATAPATGGYPMADPHAAGATVQNHYSDPNFAQSGTQDSYQYPSAPSSTSPPAYGDPHAVAGQGYAPAGPGASGSAYGSPEASYGYPQAPAYTADARSTVSPQAGGGAPAQGYPPAYTGADYAAPAANAPPAYGAAGSLPANNMQGYTADPSGFQPGQTGYAPGQTGYGPGQTGYQPTGSTPYQSPGGNYQMPQGRTDAPYRPGSTGDYQRTGATMAPPNTTAESTLSIVSPASYEGPMPETAPLNPISTTMPAEPAQLAH